MKKSLSSNLVVSSLVAAMGLLVGCSSDDAPSGAVYQNTNPDPGGSGGASAGSSGTAGAAGAKAGSGGSNAGAGGLAAGGTAGAGQAGSGQAGQGTAGQGTAGQGQAGQGTAGQGQAGQGQAGQGTAGQGQAGQGQAGQGQAGQGTAGQGTAGGGGSAEAGSAGSGGSGEAGSAGSGGSGEAGSAGGGQAGNGEAGQGQAGQGQAGKGGQGQAGKGGSGQAGKGGAAGAGTVTPETVANIGAECASDSDCGGGATCLQPDGTEIGNGGPANGFCTINCTQFLKDSAGKEAPNLPTVYPCDPSVNPNDSNATVSSYCLNFGTDDAPEGFCMPICEFGTPQFSQTQQTLDPNKCHGREDAVCYPVNDSTTNQNQFSFCRPYCQSDAQCPDGQGCDVSSGLCVANKPTLKPNGSACTVSSDPNAPQECAGVCLRLYTDGDPNVPVGKQNHGICFDPCEVGSSAACGGSGQGYCGLFNIYGPTDPSTNVSVPTGLGDLAVCSTIVPAGDDSTCLWQEGWYAFTFASANISFCLPSTECTTNADCVLTCTTAADCVSGDKCTGGKCISAGGTPDTNNTSCQKVDKACKKSYCLDHTVDPSQLTGPAAICN